MRMRIFPIANKQHETVPLTSAIRFATPPASLHCSHHPSFFLFFADTAVARRRVVIDSESDSDDDFRVPQQRKALDASAQSSAASTNAAVVKRRAAVIDSDDDGDGDHDHDQASSRHGDSENIGSGNARVATKLSEADAASERLAAILSKLSLKPVQVAAASSSSAGDSDQQPISANSSDHMAPSSVVSPPLADMSLAERKLAFNAAVRDGKAHEASSNWTDALISYTYAAALFPARDDLGIARKLASLRRKIEVQRAELEARPVDDWFRGTDAEVFMPFEPVTALASADTLSSSLPSAASSSSSSSSSASPAGPVFRLPRDVHAQLYNYQRACLHWLWRLHCGGAGTGGVLGDDMGLGKVRAVR